MRFSSLPRDVDPSVGLLLHLWLQYEQARLLLSGMAEAGGALEM